MNIKYLLCSSLISTFALSPFLLKIYLDKNNISTFFGIDTKYLLFVLLFTVFLSFKVIINLPQISLYNSINIISEKRSNMVAAKLLLIFIIITLVFLLPTYIVFSLQVYFLENEDFFKRKQIFHDDNETWFDDNAFDGYWPTERTMPLEFREYKWMQKDGQYIRLRHMTDRHLYHAFYKCGEEDVQDMMMKEMTFRLFEQRCKNGNS